MTTRTRDNCEDLTFFLIKRNAIQPTARTNELVDDIEPVDPAITDDGPAFDDNHGDEWEAEGVLTDSDNDEDEEDRVE